MIECIFTLDYEIYGDGSGTLDEFVYEPAEILREIFTRWNARFVNFVEVLEFSKIEEFRSDPGIGRVKRQVRDLHLEGFETALHLHPQWFNAKYRDHAWQLDYSEYNLCVLSRERIESIVDGALVYLRGILDEPNFTPVSFRAGNWLFQPSCTAANVLLERGLRIDSSVFKGGLLHNHGLDYRPARKNGDYWRFSGDVSKADNNGQMLEVPIYTELVPPWRMSTQKRMSFAKTAGSPRKQTLAQKAYRALDFLRFRYPLKLDFCRMTIDEFTKMLDGVIRQDSRSPKRYRPIVAIGHTKDLSDPNTVDKMLEYLRSKEVPVTTFQQAIPKLVGQLPGL